MTGLRHSFYWSGGLAALALAVIVTLPWPPVVFALLCAGLAVLHGWLAVRGGSAPGRALWIALAGLWTLGALSSLATSPQYNIRVDWAFFQLAALPLTAVAHLVASLLFRGTR